MGHDTFSSFRLVSAEEISGSLKAIARMNPTLSMEIGRILNEGAGRVNGAENWEGVETICQEVRKQVEILVAGTAIEKEALPPVSSFEADVKRWWSEKNEEKD